MILVNCKDLEEMLFSLENKKNVKYLWLETIYPEFRWNLLLIVLSCSTLSSSFRILLTLSNLLPLALLMLPIFWSWFFWFSCSYWFSCSWIFQFSYSWFSRCSCSGSLDFPDSPVPNSPHSLPSNSPDSPVPPDFHAVGYPDSPTSDPYTSRGVVCVVKSLVGSIVLLLRTHMFTNWMWWRQMLLEVVHLLHPKTSVLFVEIRFDFHGDAPHDILD